MKISSIVSIVLVVLLPLSLIVLWRLIYEAREKQMIECEEYEKQYSTLTEGLNIKTTIGCYWNVIILLRWTISTIIMITMRDYPSFQIMTNLQLTFAFQCLILGGKPFQDPKENTMSLLNEVMVSLYLYQMIALTDYNSTNPYRIQIGWTLVGTVFFSVGFNIIKFLATIAYYINQKVQLVREQRRLRAKKYMAEQEILEQQRKAAEP